MEQFGISLGMLCWSVVWCVAFFLCLWRINGREPMATATFDECLRCKTILLTFHFQSFVDCARVKLGNTRNVGASHAGSRTTKPFKARLADHRLHLDDLKSMPSICVFNLVANHAMFENRRSTYCLFSLDSKLARRGTIQPIA